MNDMSNFSDKVLKMHVKRITDEIFLMIQNDRELMYEYLRLVNNFGLNKVNTGLGKSVKAKLKLKNAGRCNKPRSTLIKSYQEFKI